MKDSAETGPWRRFIDGKGSPPIFAVRALRYMMTGGIAAIVTLGVALALTDLLGVYYLLSQAAGFLAGALVNYPLSRVWAFENSYSNVTVQFLWFVVVSLIGLGVNEGTLALAVSVIHLWVPLGMILGLGTAFMWNFLGNNYFTFGKLK